MAKLFTNVTTKSIHTLVDDIYSLFKTTHKVSDKALEEFKETVGNAVKEALEEPREKPFTVRMSNIGTPDRKYWYQSRSKTSWSPQPKDRIKFLYGHMIEALLLFLTKEAGHKVEHEQFEVDLDEVEGHIDCLIDGHVIDVKSASTFSFNKFNSNNILVDDPFGYRHQLSGYYETMQPEENEVGWLVADKQHGEISLVTYEHFELPSAKERIEHVKEMLKSDTPPERCYKPVEDKHGNQELAKGCSFCPFKTKCWPDMRVFRYSTNDRFYAEVKKQPRVSEVTEEYFKNDQK